MSFKDLYQKTASVDVSTTLGSSRSAIWEMSLYRCNEQQPSLPQYMSCIEWNISTVTLFTLFWFSRKLSQSEIGQFIGEFYQVSRTDLHAGYELCMNTHTHTHTHTHMHIHIHACTHMYTYNHTYTHPCHTRTHMHVHTHTHTHTHTHIQEHILKKCMIILRQEVVEEKGLHLYYT